MESKHKKFYRMKQRKCNNLWETLWGESHGKVWFDRDGYDSGFAQIYIKTKSTNYSFIINSPGEVYRQALNDRVRVDMNKLLPIPEGVQMFSSASTPKYRKVGKSRKKLIARTVSVYENTPTMVQWRNDYQKMWGELVSQYSEFGFGFTITSRVTSQEHYEWGKYYELAIDNFQTKTDEELVDICRKFIADRSSIGSINYGFEDYKKRK